MNARFLNILWLAGSVFVGPWCQGEPERGVRLGVELNNTDAIISWPFPSRGYELQFATNLTMPNWQPSGHAAVVNNEQWTVTTPIDPSSVFFRLKNHLQYFGFWAGSVAAGGSIREQRGTVNFTMGAGPGASADQAVAQGIKLMFFAPDFSDPNVQDQINALRPYATNMLAFFTMDEPDCVANGDTARLEQLLSSIESQISQLKVSFPDVPMMMTVGCAFWSYNNFRIPQGIDYIALE